MLAPVRTVAPADLPVSLPEVKAHLNVTTSDFDDKLDSYLVAATDEVDGYTGLLGRALVTQTWVAPFCAWDYRIRLPLAPVQSITGITYYDASNVQQTLGSSVFGLFGRLDVDPFLQIAYGQTLPSIYWRADAVNVTFVAGYGEPADVPEPIRIAILLRVESLFYPDTDNEAAITRLIHKYRRRLV